MQSQLPAFQPISAVSSVMIMEVNYPILKSSFNVHGKDVILLLTEHCIFLCENLHMKGVSQYSPLCFDLKFDILRETWPDERTPGTPIGIRFELQNEIAIDAVDFLCTSSSVIEIWQKQLGKRINQRNFHRLFKAKKKIGRGAFATVYLAERLQDKKMFAVKAFSKQKQYSSDKGKQSLKNELKLMRCIDHPNIMKLESVFETENSIYFILEFLQGVQLHERLKSRTIFTETQTQNLMRFILRALSHLNEKRIIHRDLKPENIITNEDFTSLAICDFGLATFADEEQYLFVRCGTPGFVAPEIINIVDMKTKSESISDMFSAGIIFHHLLFNCSVFPGKEYNQILKENRQSSFNFSDQKYKLASKESMELLKKMLEKEPKKRISADNALKHRYFQNQMEVETAQKVKAASEVTNVISKSFLRESISITSPSSLMTDSKKSSITSRFLDRFKFGVEA